ncbi:tyrosine-type recombinase/integrase [Vibrio sp. Vb0587]|uniref:tyrosine-type recombinase/integrase n=1 Tax=unclassified Vibrio TaxID=2614977 RepID=UPI001F01400F|nr:tyrosine-type recombinase/integrase [Vibrio sp. Vb0587]MCF7456200.1 tyrosine-type recombinase/integrase [Vibrio sp. A1-1]MDW1968001.1 tyrosine-type recombinase/integrase [Vibrio sp. Vb0587]
MSQPKRINQRIDISNDNLGLTVQGTKKRRKEPTKPPKSADEARALIEELYERSPLLSLTASMSALTGLRYSDASWLEYSDFFDEFGQWKKHFDLCQQKAFNMRIAREGTDRATAYNASLVRVYINDGIKEIVDECRYLSCSDELLFANSRSSLKQPDGTIIPRPMSVQSANWHHAKVKEKFKLGYAFGTHSWRKYFAKKMIEKGVTVEKIRDFLGQSSLNSTNHYLSTFDEQLAPIISEMSLFE